MTTPHDPHAIVREAILTIAPELERDELTDDARLQEDLDLDSMDVLDVVTELSRRAGIDIPERDHGRLVTVGDCVAYLDERAITV